MDASEEVTKKSRVSEDPMIQVLREADSESVSKVAKRHGMSEQTTYVRNTRYGTLEMPTFTGCFAELVRSQSGVSLRRSRSGSFPTSGPRAAGLRKAARRKIRLPTRK